MSAVVSKNLYELLGNTHDEDSDQEPEPPVKTVEKHVMRTSKRNAPEEPPNKNFSGSGGKGGKRGLSGNEGAYYDRNAGSASNRGKPTDTDERAKAYGQNDSRGRGGRGGRAGPRNFDRHSRGGIRDSERQVNAGWGSNEGGAELSDELAAEALAKAEKEASANWGTNDSSRANDGSGATEGWGETGSKAEPAQDVEPEEVTISYADYLLQQQEKKAALAAQTPQIRQPNEGVTDDKRWANTKPITREDNEDFFQGAGGKVKRERERRQKQVIEIDQRYTESSDRSNRGGGFQGGRGRGGRGGRGDGYQRGGRGGEKRSPGSSTSINTDDISAFPILGS